MRIEALILANLFALGGSCAAHLNPAHVLQKRHAHLDQDMRFSADKTVKRLAKRDGDVYGVPNGVWPTVVVPPGYTLAAGVQLTPIPGFATATGSAAQALATSATDSNSNTTGVINYLSGWETKAEEACMTAMMNLKGKATNPTGLAICYNVPYLDQAAGVFEAELRLYNISAPSAEWIDVSSTAMTVSMAYEGATISRSDGKTLPSKRNLRDTVLMARTGDSNAVSTPSTSTVGITGQGAMPAGMLMPVEISNPRMYVGQINSSFLSANMSSTALRTLLTPIVTISARSPSDSTQTLSTALTSNSTSFVLGVFSVAAAVATDPVQLLSNPSAALLADKAGVPTPFAIPGLHLGVTPVGLIVTCSWTIVFLAAFGLGTIGRARHRSQYREAVKAQREGKIRRF